MSPLLFNRHQRTLCELQTTWHWYSICTDLGFYSNPPPSLLFFSISGRRGAHTIYVVSDTESNCYWTDYRLNGEYWKKILANLPSALVGRLGLVRPQIYERHSRVLVSFPATPISASRTHNKRWMWCFSLCFVLFNESISKKYSRNSGSQEIGLENFATFIMNLVMKPI